LLPGSNVAIEQCNNPQREFLNRRFFMLAKNQRLNLKTNFRWVASGQSFTSRNFKLFYRLGENDHPLVGVSIVSAQFKKANLRNSAKRICFKMVREHYDQLHKNINLVIMPRAQVLELPPEELSREFQNAISNLKTN
jgi:ribonuclease P protein component